MRKELSAIVLDPIRFLFESGSPFDWNKFIDSIKWSVLMEKMPGGDPGFIAFIFIRFTNGMYVPDYGHDMHDIEEVPDLHEWFTVIPPHLALDDIILLQRLYGYTLYFNKKNPRRNMFPILIREGNIPLNGFIRQIKTYKYEFETYPPHECYEVKLYEKSKVKSDSG